MIEKDYNWVYNHIDKFVHAVKRKSKNSECNVFIERGITLPMGDMDASVLKKLCPECKECETVKLILIEKILEA